MLRRFVAVAAVAALVAIPLHVAANDQAGEAGGSLAALHAAVAVAEAHAEQRYAFTVAFTEMKEAPDKVFRLRFDPRKPEGERWAMLSPSEDALTKDERKRLKEMQSNDDADDALVYDGLSENVADAKLVSEDASIATFEAPLGDDDLPKQAREALEMVLTLNKSGGYIQTISLKATRPFKPAAVAKVDAMDQLQRYAPQTTDGPALLQFAETEVEGEALFKRFDSHTRIEYSDVEAVDAPPREE